MNRPVYQDKAWLQSKYDEVRSIYAMAEIAGCHARTIHYWMRKYSIKMHGMTGEKKSEESIRKSVEARKGKPASMTGKHHSDETKKENVGDKARQRQSQLERRDNGKDQKIPKK